MADKGKGVEYTMADDQAWHVGMAVCACMLEPSDQLCSAPEHRPVSRPAAGTTIKLAG